VLPLAPALPLLREAVPDLAAVYLFGSAAEGTETAESDVDHAVLAARPLDPVARFDLQERLALALGRNVDLVDLRAASTVMQAQVVAHGQVVLDVDPRARAEFEMVTLSAYALLNEERAGILADIRARGRVHA
jgi:uncharacterized protein